MKKTLVIFGLLFIFLEVFQPLGAINAPKVDELETMLKKIENNLLKYQILFHLN